MTRLFDTPGADAAYERWQERPDNGPKCPKFPDHDCEECHGWHLEAKEFNEFCDVCVEEKCPECEGSGWLVRHQLRCKVFIAEPCTCRREELECEKCKCTGRV